MNLPTKSAWQREDELNSKVTLADIDRILSAKFQAKMLDKHGRQFDRIMAGGYGTHMRGSRFAPRGRQEQLGFAQLKEQQQQAFGFASGGAGISIPAAVTWLSQAWDNTATYTGGGGVAPAASFVQLNGVVYAAPTTNPAGAPPGSTWVIQAPAPGGNGWNVNPNPKFSSTFSQPTSFFPAPPASTVDVVDAYWAPPDLQVLSTTASQRYIPAPGRGFLSSTIVTTASTLQANIAGSWTAVLSLPAGSYLQYLELDGMTWALLSGGTTRNTYTIYRVRQSVQ
jgi:hypothetical protein